MQSQPQHGDAPRDALRRTVSIARLSVGWLGVAFQTRCQAIISDTLCSKLSCWKLTMQCKRDEQVQRCMPHSAFAPACLKIVRDTTGDMRPCKLWPGECTPVSLRRSDCGGRGAAAARTCRSPWGAAAAAGRRRPAPPSGPCAAAAAAAVRRTGALPARTPDRTAINKYIIR